MFFHSQSKPELENRSTFKYVRLWYDFISAEISEPIDFFDFGSVKFLIISVTWMLETFLLWKPTKAFSQAEETKNASHVDWRAGRLAEICALSDYDISKTSPLIKGSFDFVVELFSFWMHGIFGVWVFSSRSMWQTFLTKNGLILSVKTYTVF